MKQSVKVYVDASANKITKTASWACVIIYPKKAFNILYGVNHEIIDHTYFELYAVYKAIKSLEDEKYPIEIYTDYELIYNAFKNDLFAKWEENGWKKNYGKNIIYPEMWEKLSKYKNNRKIKIKWTRAHVGHPGNSCVDFLANGLCKHKGDILKINWKKFYSNLGKELYGDNGEQAFNFYRNSSFFAA